MKDTYRRRVHDPLSSGHFLSGNVHIHFLAPNPDTMARQYASSDGGSGSVNGMFVRVVWPGAGGPLWAYPGLPFHGLDVAMSFSGILVQIIWLGIIGHTLEIPYGGYGMFNRRREE